MSNTPVTAEDLYLYAMGLLDDAEQARLGEFLKQSPEARAELVHVRGDLGLLAMSVETETPTPAARQRLMNQVAREPRKAAATAPLPAVVPEVEALSVPAVSAVEDTVHLSRAAAPFDEEKQPVREAPLPFRSYTDEHARKRVSAFTAVTPWLGWAVAAGLAVTAWDFHTKTIALTDQVASAQAATVRATASSAKAIAVLDTMRSGSAQRFLLTKQNTQPVPSARVTYLAEKGSLVFQGSNMDQLPPYKTYELWLIPVGKGREPIAAGTFKPDDRGFASLILPELPKGIVAGTFGVTLEDDGGSQTPTMPILMIGS